MANLRRGAGADAHWRLIKASAWKPEESPVLYAVGDIHGERAKLDSLLDSLPFEPGDRLIFLGDYVDRGPDSRGVVDRLIELEREIPCVFLLGNHESMFLDFLSWKHKAHFGRDAFLMNGGARTLESYGYFELEKPAEEFRLPEAHEKFFRSLTLYHREGDYVFVHAGLDRRHLDQGDLTWALWRAKPHHLLWDRTTGDLPHRLGATIIYGHTPESDFAVRWNLPFSIGIDTGATYGGPLSAIRLPDEKIFQSRS